MLDGVVIFYIISLHTIANHSDDYHYHNAVNIINHKHASLKLPLSTKCLHQPVMNQVKKLHRQLCTKFLLDCVCNSVKKAIRFMHVTFVT